MRVREAMTTQVVSVAPGDSAWTAAELLTRLELTGLPVATADGQVLGVLTELDLLHAWQRGDDLRAVTAAQVMHPRPIYVEPDTDLDTALAFMEEWQVRRLPVCENGRLIGVISRADILRAALGEAASR